MRLVLATVVICVLLQVVTGCGTVLNVQGMEYLDLTPSPGPRPGDRPAYQFGGLGNDVAWIRSANQPINVIGALIDMPFSLVGDVLAMPWVAYDNLVVVRPSSPQDEWRRFWLTNAPSESSANSAPAAKMAQEPSK